MNLEDVYDKYDRYLIDEYLNNGTDDFYLASIGNEATFVVPYKYVKEAGDGTKAIENFKKDLLDFQNDEIRAYKKAGKKALGYKVGKDMFVIPLGYENTMLAKMLEKQVVERVKELYQDTIEVHKTLLKNGYKVGNVDYNPKKVAENGAEFLALRERQKRAKIEANKKVTADAKKSKTTPKLESKDVVSDEKWEELLKVLSQFASFSMEKASVVLDKIKEVVRVDDKKKEEIIARLAEVTRNCLEKRKLLGEKLGKEPNFKEIVKKKDKMLDALNRHRKTLAITGLLCLGVVTGNLFMKNDGKSDVNNNPVVVALDNSNNGANIVEDDNNFEFDKGYFNENGDYVDFMNRVHSDKYGNLKRIAELRPQISAMLVMLEGMSEKAFTDGKGIYTIGAGSITHIDDEGGETRVKKGDVLENAGEAMDNKWKYNDKNMIELCGDKVGRTLTDQEIYTCIGAGYCWGKNAFVGSELYKSIKNNEGEDAIYLKATGFRKQKGLLKRAFFFTNWHNIVKSDKCLNLPIYEIKGKGYVHCSVYTLELRDIMPCQKDKKGNFKKDVNGNDMPCLYETNKGFCQPFYKGISDEIVDRLISDGLQSGINNKPLRELLPNNYIKEIGIANNNSKQIGRNFKDRLIKSFDLS